MKKIVLILFFVISSEHSHAEYNRAWLEVGASGSSTVIQVKARDEYQGWALSYLNYQDHHDSFLKIFPDSYRDKNTMEFIETDLDVFAISKFVSAPFSWGYADVGIGVGVGKGQWLDNCNKTGSFLGDQYECDLREGTKLGLPFQASATLGRYIGIGVNFNMFLAFDLRPHYQLALTVPLGKFTK